MKLVETEITFAELEKMSEKMFGKLIKAVVDVDREIMVVDSELHSDQEEFLLELGSKQEDLWGINLHPNKPAEQFVEFDSMINLRPYQGNSSRGVENVQMQTKIKKIVARLVKL